MSSAISLSASKKRYEWIDNSRVIASFLIMYVHLHFDFPNTSIITNEVARLFWVESTYSGRVAMFLMLSGYLFGRHASLSKTLDRFVWLLIPYLLWNFIIFGIYYTTTSMPSQNIWSLLGIGAIFDTKWTITSVGACPPILNVPSWYMRDMLPLTLITPLLVRFKKYLPVALILFMLFQPSRLYMNPAVIMAPSTCFFYAVGICLTRFKIEDGYRLFNDKTTPLFVVLLIAACVASLNHTLFQGRPVRITIIGMLVGAMIIAHFGVMIEKHLPKLSRKLAPLGPASFLVFMIHFPFFDAIYHFIPGIRSSLWMFFIPIPTYVIIVTIFLTMKRYTPWLMPYLGHMKIKKKAE